MPNIAGAERQQFCKKRCFDLKTLLVPPTSDKEPFPEREYACQSTGDTHPEIETTTDLFARDGSIKNTDIICYIQLGLIHFPRPKTFPSCRRAGERRDPCQQLFRKESRRLKRSSTLPRSFPSPKAGLHLSGGPAKDLVQRAFGRAGCEYNER